MTGEAGDCVRVRVAACPAAFSHPPTLGEVFVWVVDLCQPPVAVEELFRRLTAEERTRAIQYKIAKAREQFVIGRGLLRGMLADYIGVDPLAVPLTYLPSRKPVLKEPAQVHFNLTHTDGIAILVAAQRRVGVDVEHIRLVENAEGLVARFFSQAESAVFHAMPEEHRPRAFFRGWTCKEAVIKAAGATVSCLADFDVELCPDRPPRVKGVRNPQLATGSWALAEWTTPDNATVALAVEGAEKLVMEKCD